MLVKLKQELINKGEIILKIKVHPNANRTIWKEKMSDGTIKVDIAAVPEDGKANTELIDFIAQEFEIKKRFIKLVSGKKDRNKIIHITLST